MTYLQLRYSNDGGSNYSSWRDLDAGSTGGFIKEMVARRLGFCRQRVWEFCDTSDVATEILSVSIDMESE